MSTTRTQSPTKTAKETLMKIAKKSTKSKRKRAAKTAKAPATNAAPRKERAFKPDPRLPAPGTEIRRTYKGKEIVVRVEADGLHHDGTRYASATALAMAVTHYPSVNGMLWLGLTKPKSAPKKPRATREKA